MDADKIETSFWKGFRKSPNSYAPLVPEPYADFYKMDHPKRGVALIFNHVNFVSPSLSKREGSNKDRDDLIKLFHEMGFYVDVYNDLGVVELNNTLLKVSKMDHSESDCLVVVVMSHGENGKLYARDGMYQHSRLWKYFSVDLCPQLAGKPKFFFIQACRGNEIHKKKTVQYKKIIGHQVDANKSDEDQFYSIPVYSDILVMYSTMEGFVAWRDPLEGSHFIQALIRELRKRYHDYDLLTILTFVNREVAVGFESNEPNYTKYSGAKQMCSIVSMLTRMVRF